MRKHHKEAFMKAYIFLAAGFEEAEAVDVADILERGGMEIDFVSIDNSDWVKGARGFTLKADVPFSGTDFTDGDVFFIPGGIPGAPTLAAFKPLGEVLKQADQDGKTIAAICAGPIVLKSFGLVEDRTVTAHSSVRDRFEPRYYDADHSVVRSSNIFTGKGLGAALELGLTLVSCLLSPEKANQISLAIENGPFQTSL